MSDWLAWQVVDSAFPVGVFAHSWGLEAAWQAGHVDGEAALRQFLTESIRQTGWSVLPLVNSAYRQPERLAELDALTQAFLTNSWPTGPAGCRDARWSPPPPGSGPRPR